MVDNIYRLFETITNVRAPFKTTDKDGNTLYLYGISHGNDKNYITYIWADGWKGAQAKLRSIKETGELLGQIVGEEEDGSRI